MPERSQKVKMNNTDVMVSILLGVGYALSIYMAILLDRIIQRKEGEK